MHAGSAPEPEPVIEIPQVVPPVNTEPAVPNVPKEPVVPPVLEPEKVIEKKESGHDFRIDSDGRPPEEQRPREQIPIRLKLDIGGVGLPVINRV